MGPALLFLLALPMAEAADVEVCDTCAATTIAAGVALAGTGDTVIVHPGTWTGSVSVTRDVAIVSVAGAAATVWVGDGAAVVASRDAAVRVEGFTLVPAGAITPVDPTDAAPASIPEIEPFPSRAVAVRGGSAVLVDVVVRSHRSSLAGAAVLADEAHVTIEDSAFSGLESTAEDGGAVAVDEGTLVVVDTAFANNVAPDGGAIAARNTAVTLVDATFARNATPPDGSGALTGKGGAVYLDGGSAEVRRCWFDGGAARKGGHVAASHDAVIAVEDTVFEGGRATEGGAVFVGGAGLQVVRGLFHGSEAASGGAIHAVPSSDVFIRGTRFEDNVADQGGAIRVVSNGRDIRPLRVESGRFVGNAAGVRGGAIAARQLGPLEISGSLFVANTVTGANAGGGAIQVSSGQGLSLVDSLLCDNASAGTGGAIVYDGDGDHLLSHVAFARNSAVGGAGALLFDGGTLEARHLDFLDNTAGAVGVVGQLRHTPFTIVDSIVDPTPGPTEFRSAFAITADGASASAVSDFNLWWTDKRKSYGGDLGPEILGQDELQADPLVVGYATDGACVDLTFALAEASPARHAASDGTDIGVTGGEGVGFVDVDQDGFIAVVDCDDAVTTVHPGALELCNGVDDDCDGVVDDLADAGTVGGEWYPDSDNDGFGDRDAEPVRACVAPRHHVADHTDCDDGDRLVNPGAEEVWYDGVDQDCSGGSDFDQDGDGFDVNAAADPDCDDLRADIHPGAREIWYDGVDQDCSGGSDFDQDGDGVDIDDPLAPDCDDLRADIHPGAREIWYDGVDQDCSGGSDFDQDGDGVDIDDPLAPDCDDLRADIHPGAEEVWYDGVDQDCSGGSDFDQDGDDFEVAPSTPPLLRDCDDRDEAIHPTAPEVPYDGVDQDCDGADLVDVDGDGYAAEHVGGADCDDNDPDVHPGAVDAWYDGVDADCAGDDDFDADGDGYTIVDADAPDCDDDNDAVHPGAADAWYDGVDTDCGGDDDFDADRDGYRADRFGGEDCDDTNPDIHPGARDVVNGDVDLDCDGHIDRTWVTGGGGCATVGGTSPAWLALPLLLGLRRRRPGLQSRG